MSGNAIDLFGKIENFSAATQTVGFDLAINGGQAGTGEFNPVNGDLVINSANVFTNANTLHVYGVNNKTVTFGAGTVISQGGAFNVEQASNVVFLGNNTYTGTTNVLAGSLTAGGGGTTGPLGTGTVTVASGATLTCNRSDAVTLGQTLNRVGGNNAVLTSVTVNGGALTLLHTTDNFDRGYFTGTTPININAGATVNASSLWTIKSTNVVTVNGGTLNFNTPFVANVSDTNYVNNLTLQNGATNVNAGALITSPAQTGATSVTVADGATFGVKLATAGTTFNSTSLTTGVTTGAALQFDTAALGNPTAPVINTGTFTPTAATVLRLTGSALAAGPTFTLLDYTGGIGGTGFAGLTLSLPFRVGGSLVNNTGNTSVDVTVSGAETAKWEGNVAGGDWDIDPDGGNTAGTINWKTSVLNTPTRYAQGAVNTDSVTFDDTATGTTNVNLTTTLTPVNVTVNM